MRRGRREVVGAPKARNFSSASTAEPPRPPRNLRVLCVRKFFCSQDELMLLAIDAGNTNIVFAICDGVEIRAEWRAVMEQARTADEYAVLVGPLLSLSGMSLSD